MIFCNAGETIGYKNTKIQSQIEILYGVTLWSFLLSIPTIIIYSLVGEGQLFGNFNWVSFAFILLSACLTIASIITWASASKNLPMSIAEGVSEIYIAFLTFFSWLLFGGKLNYWHIILIAVVVLACLVLAFIQNKGGGKSKYNLKLGFIFLAVWVVLSIAKGLIPGLVAVDGLNGFAYNFVLACIMLVASVAFIFSKNSFASHKIKRYPLKRSDGIKLGSKEREEIVSNKKFLKTTISVLKDPWLFVVGFCRTASQISLIYLALKMNLGIVEAVSVFGIVLIMLYERIVMKEKISITSYIILIIIAFATAILGIV